MKEQGFKYEFDETDHLAKHMLLFEDDIPVATCRFFFSVERDCYVIGRIAVSKEFRGLKIIYHTQPDNKKASRHL